MYQYSLKLYSDSGTSIDILGERAVIKENSEVIAGNYLFKYIYRYKFIHIFSTAS